MSRAEFVVRKVLEQDRPVVVFAVALVTGIAWLWLLFGSQPESGMTSMDGMSMSDHAMSIAAWSPAYAAAIFVMWVVMMIAMMLPSAAPTLLLYLQVNTRRTEGGSKLLDTGAFAVGYLVVWLAFSAAATTAQWFLDSRLLMSPDMRVTSYWLGAAILLVAGAGQFTPLKAACLKNCRSPIGFLSTYWKSGLSGAIRMGLRHGLYCLGCCWVLMILLFIGGVMNIYWIAGVALFVGLEKLAPGGRFLGRVAGVILIGAAFVVALQGSLET